MKIHFTYITIIIFIISFLHFFGQNALNESYENGKIAGVEEILKIINEYQDKKIPEISKEYFNNKPDLKQRVSAASTRRFIYLSFLGCLAILAIILIPSLYTSKNKKL